MKINDEAFTMMETLVTIAIIVVISSVFITAFGSAEKGVSKSFKVINTANMLIGIDNYIRERTNDTYIPYWAYNKPYIDNLKDELYRSKYGRYIKSVSVIANYPKAPRGIEVVYEVNNHEMRTVALLPSVAVLEETQ